MKLGKPGAKDKKMKADVEKVVDPRERILAAATGLIRQHGSTQFNMRAVAKHASVSLVTAYKLFGSRAGLIEVLLQEGVTKFLGLMEKHQQENELDYLFRRIMVCVELCQAGEFEKEIFKDFNLPPDEGMYAAVRNGIDTGHIRKDIDHKLFVRQVTSDFYRCLHNLAVGRIEIDQLFARAAYGLSVSLAGVATPLSAERMQDNILKYQNEFLERNSKRLKKQSSS